MKKDNQPWLQNIESFLYNIGMGVLWLNPGLGDTNYIQGIITNRLQNIFRQKEYICSFIKKTYLILNTRLNKTN